MRHTRLFLLLVLFALPASAQQLTLYSSDFIANDGAEGLGLHRLHLGIAAPLRIGGVSTTHGFRFRQLTTHGDWDSVPPDPGTLREVRYEFSATVPVAETWAVTMFVAPGLTSDFGGDITGDDFDLRTALIAQKAGANWSYGLGIAYRNQLDFAVAPVIRLSGPLSEKASLDIVAPAQAHFWYQLGRARAGIQFRYTTYAFHLTDSGAYERLDHTLITAGPVVELPVSGPIAVRASVAYAIKNRLEWDIAGEEVVSNTPSIPVGRLALIFRR